MNKHKILKLICFAVLYIVSWIILLSGGALIINVDNHWIKWPIFIIWALIMWVFQVETLGAFRNTLRNKDPHWFRLPGESKE